VAHENLISGAAHSGNIDAHRTLFFGQVNHLRLSCRSDDHLREQRLVAVHYDVDLVGLQHSQVGLGEGGRRCAEEHILQLSGDHGAAPAVGYAGSQALQDEVHRIVVHSDVGAVHDLHDLPVDAPGIYPQLFP